MFRKPADVPREGEIGVPVAAVVLVVEDAADAARFLAVRQAKIFVAPFLIFVIGRDAHGVAGGLHRRMKARVGIVLGAPAVEHRRQIGAAAEPGFGGHDHAGVHVHRRHMRIARMGDQRDARGPEARVLGGARICLPNSGAKSPCTVELARRPSRTAARASSP